MEEIKTEIAQKAELELKESMELALQLQMEELDGVENMDTVASNFFKIDENSFKNSNFNFNYNDDDNVVKNNSFNNPFLPPPQNLNQNINININKSSLDNKFKNINKNNIENNIFKNINNNNINNNIKQSNDEKKKKKKKEQVVVKSSPKIEPIKEEISIPKDIVVRIEIRNELNGKVKEFSEAIKDLSKRLNEVDGEIRDFYRHVQLLEMADEEYDQNYSNCREILEGTLTSYRLDIKGNFDEITIKKVKSKFDQKIIISPNLMGKGTFRLAYFAKFLPPSPSPSPLPKMNNNKNNNNNNNNNNIGKSFNNIFKNDNIFNNNSLNKSEGNLMNYFNKNEKSKSEKSEIEFIAKAQKTFTNEKKKCLLDIQTHLFSQLFAEKYNEISQAAPIHFTKIYLMKLNKEYDWFGAKYLIIEEKIHGKFTKFNNNSNFINKYDQSSTAQSFSHFTYNISKGKYMIVDIQGAAVSFDDLTDRYYQLTDPCVHSESRTFGEGDWGERGMTLFFEKHQCNQLCKHLELSLSPFQSNKNIVDHGSTVPRSPFMF